MKIECVSEFNNYKNWVQICLKINKDLKIKIDVHVLLLKKSIFNNNNLFVGHQFRINWILIKQRIANYNNTARAISVLFH